MMFSSEDEEMIRRAHSIVPVAQLYLNNERWLKRVATESEMDVEEVRSMLTSALEKAKEIAPID